MITMRKKPRRVPINPRGTYELQDPEGNVIDTFRLSTTAMLEKERLTARHGKEFKVVKVKSQFVPKK